MKKEDQTIGTFALILSGLVIEESLRLPHQLGTFGPGVSFFPFWLGVLMAGLSIILIIHAWRRPAEEIKKKTFPGRQASLSIVLILSFLAAYIFFLDILGFILDTILFNILLLAVVMRETWKKTLLVALGTSAGLYLIFQVLLEVPLPKNSFGF